MTPLRLSGFMLVVALSNTAAAKPHFGLPPLAPSPGAAVPAPSDDCDDNKIQYSIGKNVLCLVAPTPSDTTTGKNVIILPSEAPPSRTRLHFDSPTGGHAEVEWSSRGDGDLSRTVFLPYGAWQVSFHVSPLPHPTDPHTDFAWRVDAQNAFSGLKNKSAGDPSLGHVVATLPLEPTLGPDGKRMQKNERFIYIAFREAAAPSIESVVASLGERGGESKVSKAEFRSMDAASGAIDDTLQLLTQIALDRAETQALDVVKERAADQLCKPERSLNQKTCEVVGATGCREEFILLPKTCDAIQGLRLRELASAGPGLERAVVEDLTTFGTRAMTSRIFTHVSVKDLPAADAQNLQKDLENIQGQLKPLLVHVNRLILTASTKRANPSAAEIQGILHALASMAQEKSAHGFQDPNLKVLRFGLTISIATLAMCEQQGRCNGRFIAEVLTAPQNYFDLEGSLDKDFQDLAKKLFGPPAGADAALKKAYLELRPRLEKFVTQGMVVLEPPSDAPAREVARQALHLTLDAVDLLATLVSDTATTKPQWELVRARISAAHDVVDGVFGKDLQPLLVATLHLIQTFKWDQLILPPEDVELEKGARVLGALAAYAATYERPGMNGAEREQLQARRKESLEALIEVATDRRDRDGESIFSLGINVGFTGIGGRKLSGESTELQWLQLGLPLGIAYQHFALNSPTGIHAQLSVLDLGQYAAFDTHGQATPPRWQTAITAGLQVGLILGEPKHPFIIGADLRYSPALFPDEGQQNKGALGYGLFLGYYVPLFDLN